MQVHDATYAVALTLIGSPGEVADDDPCMCNLNAQLGRALVYLHIRDVQLHL